MSDNKKYTPRMLSLYKDKIVASLMKDLAIKNIMLVPKIEKIVLNMGLGNAKAEKNSLKQAQDEISLISGQKPIVTCAKKAISNFKIREGDPVGVKVTLRSTNMYEFLDRFISVASPRIRDFRGISSKGFDGRGNYSFGIDEQIIFPEVDYDKVNEIRGMDCTIVTTTDNDNQAYALIKAFGFPIKDRKNSIKEADSSSENLKESQAVTEDKSDSANLENQVQENLEE